MQQILNALSDSLLEKPFDTCSLNELLELSNKYPYSSAIQLLYAQKLKQAKAGDELFEQQLQKTLLYYSNPLFIHHIINDQAASSYTQLSHNRIASGENSKDSPLSYPQQDDAQNSSSDKIIQQAEEHITDITEDTDNHTDIINNADRNEAQQETSENPPLPVFKIEAIDPATAELSFTPYHTIDYFAAQGIKLSEEQQANDKFGNQLKSFTDWLKQMKRLPGATVKSTLSLTEEKNIEQMAGRSLSGDNADTEAMAEVWIKQGDLKKAIKIYQKLSLLNPSKSAYFAAKTDYLKKSI